ncbi:MAG: hypothetical protein ACR2NB_04100 [Solirubrobacteraceae bacterium]
MMVERATLPIGPIRVEADGRVDWSDAQRETAFEVWMLHAGRNLALSEKLLRADPHRLPVPYTTLWEWRRRHRWDLEADARLAELSPNLRARAAASLEVAAQECAAYLVAVASGSAAADRDRVAACKLALEGAGMIGNRPPRPDAPGTRVPPARPALLSDAERLRIAAKLAASLAPIPPTDAASA